jgi:hypothetical protein
MEKQKNEMHQEKGGEVAILVPNVSVFGLSKGDGWGVTPLTTKSVNNLIREDDRSK